jgi:hypothetical protein
LAERPELVATAARLVEVGPELRRVLVDLVVGSYKRARLRPGRAAHDSGITATGQLRVLDAPALPPHHLLLPGMTYRVVLRHSNARGFPDDAVLDGRGAALRLLQPSGDPNDPLLDVVMVTGRAFLARDAAAFARWASAGADARAQMLREDPRIAESLHDLIRDPASYATLHYHSQTTYRFVGLDGVRRLVRYRLVPADRAPDGGFVDAADLRLPLDYAPRRTGDARPADYLRAELRDRVALGEARYLLQIALAEDVGDADALDPSQAWDEAAHPWHDAAEIALDGFLSSAEGEALRFNPANAPPELGLIPAERADDPASVNHARAVAYVVSACARHGEELPLALRELVYLGEGAEPTDSALKTGLVSAATALLGRELPWQAGAPRARIPAALRASGLAAHPAALERVVDRFVQQIGAAPSADPRDGATRAELERFASDLADYFLRAHHGEAAALRGVVESYAPVCLEAFGWNELLGVQFFASHDEYLAYMNRTTRILPTGGAVPDVARTGPDEALAVMRLMSPEERTGLALLSEYACALRRIDGRWAMRSVLETEYREEALGADGGAAQIAAYATRPLADDERDFKLCLARAGGLLVDEYEASLGTPTTTGANVGEPARRICVIGAGPAGLTIARELERRGHRVTVLERTDHVGGKASSIEIDERFYDWGAHVCIGEHLAAWRLAHEVGCQIEPVVQSRIYDLERRETVVPRSAFAHVDALRAYRAARAAFPRIAGRALREIGHALDAPIADVLQRPEGSALAAAGPAYTGAGYGFLTDPELPALYVARFAEPAAGLGVDPTPEMLRRWTVEGGFQDLWRRVAARLRDVRLGARIEAVVRDATGVTIRTRDGDERFDALVLACPLDRALTFLDADADERDLFGRVRYVDYYTTFASASGLPRLGFYMIKQHVENPASAGHVATFHHRYPETDVYAFYSYGAPDLTPGGVQRLLREDVEAMGGRLDAIHAQRRWAYFPHVSSQDAAAGYFDRLDALQGRRATYYVGGLLAFELIEYVVQQAQDIAERFFPAIGAEPAAVVAPAAAPIAAAPTVVPVTVGARSSDEIRDWLIGQIARRTGLAIAAVDPTAPIETFPLESLQVVGLIADLSHWLGWQVTPSIIFQWPTIDAIAGRLAEELAEAGVTPTSQVEEARGGGLFGRVRRAIASRR